jgi:HlyD family secretion protein
LRAPFDGTVVDINVSVNQMVGPETWAVVVADFSQWYADTSDLSELDVVKVSVGQTVTVTADALPGVTMTSVVEEISAAPKTQSGDVLYTVHIRMEEVDPLLRWGMTMEVTFSNPK